MNELLEKIKGYRWWTILKALAFEGGPSSTKWVYLAMNGVLAAIPSAITAVICWVYVRSTDHHVDGGLLAALVTIVGIVSTCAVTALNYRRKVNAQVKTGDTPIEATPNPITGAESEPTTAVIKPATAAMVLFAALAFSAGMSGQITVSANSCIATADLQKVATGTFEVQLTDGNDNPVFVSANGVQVTSEPVRRVITTGSVPSFYLPTPSDAVPTNFFARVTVTNKTTNKVTVYRRVSVNPVAGVWDWCHATLTQSFAGVPTVPVKGDTGAQGQTGCILTTSPCSPTLAGVPVDNYASFGAAVAACGTTDICDLVTSTSIAVDTRTLASNIIPRFVGRGQWVSGQSAAVTISSGMVVAVPGVQIFNGVSITGLQEAHPDWFATPSMGVYPATALRGAFNATVTGATIRLGLTPYKSDFTLDGVTSAQTGGTAGGRRWLGAGRPQPDTLNNTTRLVPGTGTIIYGPFIHSGYPVFQDLGVDCGPWWQANLNGGNYPSLQNGLEMENMDTTGNFIHNDTNTGPQVRNVAVVSTPRTSNHLFLVESYTAPKADGFYGYVGSASTASDGGWGFIVKSDHGDFRNINVWGAADGGVYDKSDGVTNAGGHNPNGHSGSNHYSGVRLLSNGSTGGGRFRIHASSGDTNEGSSVDGLIIENAYAGIVDTPDSGGPGPVPIKRWSFRKVEMIGMKGPCLYTNALLEDFSLDDFKCQTANTGSLGALLISSKASRMRISNGYISQSAGSNDDAIILQGNSAAADPSGTLYNVTVDGSAVAIRMGGNVLNVDTGVLKGWSVDRVRVNGSQGPSVYCSSCDRTAFTNVSVSRIGSTFDPNGVMYFGGGWNTLSNVSVTSNSQHFWGLVSYGAMTTADRFFCSGCSFTAVGKNTNTGSLRVHGLFFDTTPTAGSAYAPYYTYSETSTPGSESTKVSDF